MSSTLYLNKLMLKAQIAEAEARMSEAKSKTQMNVAETETRLNEAKTEA